MVSTSTLCKNLLNVKNIMIEDVKLWTDKDTVRHLTINAKPYKKDQNRCPICGAKYPGYDTGRISRSWRALDFGGVIVQIVADTSRIECPHHGVHVASVPWAYPGSRFTKEFETSTAWLATQLNKSAVAKYMRISWDTVGKIICVDAFHVVEWAMKALDNVRRQSWHEAKSVAESYGKRRKGHPKAADEEYAAASAARQRSQDIKGSAYALGKAPENLTTMQEAKLEMIQLSDNRLYRAYKLKEMLRLLLKMTNVDTAEGELTRWVKWARHCRIPEFVELQRKIMRHKDHILNTIQLQVSNARIESTNNKIKLIIRRSFGFRNIQNMLDMVLLVCSNLNIPLPNRP